MKRGLVLFTTPDPPRLQPTYDCRAVAVARSSGKDSDPAETLRRFRAADAPVRNYANRVLEDLSVRKAALARAGGLYPDSHSPGTANHGGGGSGRSAAGPAAAANAGPASSPGAASTGAAAAASIDGAQPEMGIGKSFFVPRDLGGSVPPSLFFTLPPANPPRQDFLPRRSPRSPNNPVSDNIHRRFLERQAALQDDLFGEGGSSSRRGGDVDGSGDDDASDDDAGKSKDSGSRGGAGRAAEGARESDAERKRRSLSAVASRRRPLDDCTGANAGSSSFRFTQDRGLELGSWRVSRRQRADR